MGDAVDEVLDVPRWEAYLAEFDVHAPRLYRLGHLLLRGQPDEVDDVVQEIFLAAHAPWCAGTVDDLGPYLRRSLVNKVMNTSRHRGVVTRFLQKHRPDVGHSPEFTSSTNDHMALMEAIVALPPRQRAVVALRYYEDLTLAQTAEMLGISVGTVKSQIHDALARLRVQLGEF